MNRVREASHVVALCCHQNEKLLEKHVGSYFQSGRLLLSAFLADVSVYRCAYQIILNGASKQEGSSGPCKNMLSGTGNLPRSFKVVTDSPLLCVHSSHLSQVEYLLMTQQSTSESQRFWIFLGSLPCSSKQAILVPSVKWVYWVEQFPLKIHVCLETSECDLIWQYGHPRWLFCCPLYIP